MSCILLDHQGVHALMQSPIVQSVLNTGVDRNCVRTVVEKMLRETGTLDSDVICFEWHFVYNICILWSWK